MGSALMQLGIRAMIANQAALQTTSHNIANANVAYYSRQSVELATAKGQFTGAGFFGRGVDVVSVARAHDAHLTREAASARSLEGLDAARLRHMQRMESVFRPGEASLGFAASEFLNSMSDLATRPSDASTRQVVLARAADLASRLSEASDGLEGVQAGLTAEIKGSVDIINQLAEQVAIANQRIAEVKGLGQPANDLLDQRDRLIAEISKYIAVTRVESTDGTSALFVGGGQRLVLGAHPSKLEVLPDLADARRVRIGITEGTVKRSLDQSSITGGELAGLLRFQTGDLASARALVGQYAAALVGAINNQQTLGLNLHPPLGTVTGSPLFSIGAPLALPYSSNQQPPAPVALTITNHAALQASDYEMVEDASNPGSFIVTRLRDGLVRSVASGDEIDGFRIDIGPPAPAAGDRYLLQPVSRAAGGVRRLLDDPRDLAAALPLVASTSAANTGTVSVSALTITSNPLPVAGATARITFTSDTGDYSWDLLDSSNNVLSSGTGTWAVGQTLPANALDINGFTLNLSGVPRTGDVINVEPTPASAVSSNNGNALAMLLLRERGVVNGISPGESWAGTMAEIGVRVQTATSTAEMSAGTSVRAEAARSSMAGVNLDEEAARLIMYQQSYQAAAKVLQVAQSLFDELLAVSRG